MDDVLILLVFAGCVTEALRILWGSPVPAPPQWHGVNAVELTAEHC
ncbi:hypothetical protein AB0C06_26830 [Micromonospora inaquosa]|nr:hypothetical protein [Micromonospora inaquosa]